MNPLTENAAPVTVPCEMVTFDPPLFVSDSGRICEFPTCTLLKLRLVGLALRTPGELDPVPESGTVSVPLFAFEVIVSDPLTSLADWGANVTVAVALWPGGTVAGNAMPLQLNPAPVAAICEIVTAVPPLFMMPTACC